MGRLSLGGAFVASLAGCSVLYSPSLDEFSRGSSDAGAAASGDGGPGAPSTEGGAPVDGGTPPGVVACPDNALLCDDFERETVLGAFEQAENLVSISRTQAHSPSRSLSAILRNGQSTPYLASEFTGPPKVRLSYWFFAATPPPAYRVRLAHLLFGPGCDWDLSWTITLSDEGLSASADTYDDVAQPNCAPVDGTPLSLLTAAETYVPRWHHVVATIDVSTRTRKVDLEVDDGPVRHAEVVSKRSTVPDNLLFAIGVPCVQELEGCFDWDRADYGLFVDDVVLAPP